MIFNPQVHDNAYFDHIIIGSGISGLIAAAEISLSHQKCLVIEQNSFPGGSINIQHQASQKHDFLYSIDNGIPLCDAKHSIFRKLGLNHVINLVSSNYLYDVKDSNQSYKIPAGFNNAKNYLIQQFPASKRGIKRYFSRIRSLQFNTACLPIDMNYMMFSIFMLYRAADINYPMQWKHTAKGWMDKHIKDEKLKNILNANIMFYGDNPYEVNLVYHSMRQASYYDQSCVIQGGSAKLIDHLVKTINNNGGQVIYNTCVNKILLQDENTKIPLCIGVQCCENTTGRIFNVFLAKQAVKNKIICNCSPEVVFNALLPIKFNQQYQDSLVQRKFKPAKVGSSFVDIHFQVSVDLNTLFPNNLYQTFIISNLDDKLDYENRQEDILSRDFMFIDHSKIDSRLTSPSVTMCCLVFVSHIQEWKNMTESQIEAQKQAILQAYFVRLEAHYPGIQSVVSHFEIFTPDGLQARTSSSSPHGWAPQFFGAAHRAKTCCELFQNLMFSSCWGSPGGGLTGTVINGHIAARYVLEPNAYAKRIAFFVSFVILLVLLEILKALGRR
ncbi:All-trans-retinol 13,14-reductase [Spironucleus salmonicida]|uniref:All-trans-retinol 13,14-reductase n=1 Tax=Spironucleus salmonicida TaxID=348837 RepID=V6LKP5_9EUKA|nr:All-trans-retinol 13,14-reductase [Spironucleus salmonicida]|eukprot:EST44301.1 Carotenoid isomerase [Spironucleus salmonicida]